MENILLWGLVPPILLLIYTWHLDRIEREPLGLVIKVFVFGALSVLVAMVLEILAAMAMSYLNLNETSYLYLILDNFLAVALIEEFSKRLPVRRIIWKNAEFNYRFDAIVYCLASALGFAAAENITYMVSYGTGIALGRLIPVHAVCSVYMGHYLGAAKTAELDGNKTAMKKYSRLSLFVPMLIHGFWDFSLSSEEDIFYLAALFMIVVLTVSAFGNLHKYSKEDRPV